MCHICPQLVLNRFIRDGDSGAGDIGTSQTLGPLSSILPTDSGSPGCQTGASPRPIWRHQRLSLGPSAFEDDVVPLSYVLSATIWCVFPFLIWTWDWDQIPEPLQELSPHAFAVCLLLSQCLCSDTHEQSVDWVVGDGGKKDEAHSNKKLWNNHKEKQENVSRPITLFQQSYF